MFDQADRLDMLAAVGTTATTDTAAELLVTRPSLYSPFVAMESGGIISSENPTVWADPDTVEAAGVSYGEAGTVLTIGAETFRALSKTSERTGFLVIELGAV